MKYDKLYWAERLKKGEEITIQYSYKRRYYLPKGEFIEKY
jgi:hypothetical protein